MAPMGWMAIALAALAPLTASPQQTGARAGQAAPSIVGRWQSPDSVVQINADGTLTINGTLYRYLTQGNVLMLIGNDGVLPMPYQLAGDTLTVTLGGRVVAMQRLAPGQTPAGGRAAGGAASGGSAPRASELAGKWCYFANVNATNGGGRMTDECMTLYANGTYDYSRESSASAYAPGAYGSTASQQRDAGTWTLDGGTLTAMSQTQGRVSYAFSTRNHPKTNDPMICLDGRCFVTYSPKPPWRDPEP
jgi:hypothetical protein